MAEDRSSPEGDLSPAEPRLPAFASPWKLRKDALGGAHVLNKTQIFFLAMVHFSQLTLSRLALNRKKSKRRFNEKMSGNIKPSHWPEPLWAGPAASRSSGAPSLQGLARGEAEARCEQKRAVLLLREARAGVASEALPATSLGGRTEPGPKWRQGEGARDCSGQKPTRPSPWPSLDIRPILGTVTLSTFYAKSYACLTSLTTMGTGTSKADHKARPIVPRKEGEQGRGCSLSLPLMGAATVALGRAKKPQARSC